jgi:hypothetical protein
MYTYLSADPPKTLINKIAGAATSGFIATPGRLFFGGSGEAGGRVFFRHPCWRKGVGAGVTYRIRAADYQYIVGALVTIRLGIGVVFFSLNVVDRIDDLAVEPELVIGEYPIDKPRHGPVISVELFERFEEFILGLVKKFVVKCVPFGLAELWGRRSFGCVGHVNSSYKTYRPNRKQTLGVLYLFLKGVPFLSCKLIRMTIRRF